MVGIATVEDHDGAGIEAQRASDAALMHAAFGDEGKTGQQPLMIEQQIQLHGALGAPVLRPVEDAGAEFDQGGVQAQQLVLEAEAMRTGSFAAAAQQLIKHGAVQLPGPMLVGIGQGGALGRIGQPQVPQLAFAGGQSAANLAQGLRPPQVTEQHGHELSLATKPASVALGPVLGDRLLELLAGKQLQHLAENAGYSYHGGGGSPYDSRLATKTVGSSTPAAQNLIWTRVNPNQSFTVEYSDTLLVEGGHRQKPLSTFLSQQAAALRTILREDQIPMLQ